jgi:hypothetical protein
MYMTQDELKLVAERINEMARFLALNAERRAARRFGIDRPAVFEEARRQLTQALYSLQQGRAKEAKYCAGRAAELLGHLAQPEPAPCPPPCAPHVAFTSWGG